MQIPSTNGEPHTSNSRDAGFVLVVDDEEQNRMLLKDPLEARGYKVAEAQNGMEALQKVAENPPDVILLDVMMPRLDGFEVCRRLRKYGKTTSIPILMVTALSERNERLMGIQAGANDFLTKPIDIQDVLLRVGNAVYARHLFNELQTERQKSEQLLLNVLPKTIADRMRQGELSIADHIPDASVLLADLVGFTTLSVHIGPDQMISLLNEIFSSFDVLVEKHGLDKIKTIGDAYMVAGGVLNTRADHLEAIAALAMDMRRQIDLFNSQYNTSIRIRIGINTGPIIAGVIGRKTIAYDLWGDTINIACRVSAFGEPGSIQVTEPVHNRLSHKYRFSAKRNVELKGRGEVALYTMDEHEPVSARPA